MRRRRGLWVTIGVIAAVLLAGRAAAGAYADYLWYDAVGARDAWSARVLSAMALHGIAFVAGTAIAFVNLWGVRHSVVSLVMPRQLGNIEIGEEVPGRSLMAVVIVISVILGVAFAIPASDWQGFTLARHGVAFDQADPYFNTDIGFFVYWLPFEESVFEWTVGVVTVVAAFVIALYALTPSLKLGRGTLHVSAYVRRHISVLGGVALALLAWSFRLHAYRTLTHGSAPDGGFGAFDHQLGVPASLVLAYIAISASLVVAWAGWTGQLRIAFTIMTVVLLLTPTMQYVLPFAVRWASAPVDPAVRDRTYAADRAGFTRIAFGVDRIRVDPGVAAWPDVRSAATLTAWDPAPLARAIERTRRHGFVLGAPNLVASPNGPVLESVEQPAQSSDPASDDWTVVRTLAAVTDDRGAIQRVDAGGRFPLEDRSIGPALVFDGARGPLVVTNVARPPAAPLVESFFARLAEAWSEQDFRLLSTAIKGARMMTHRDVRDRVAAIVPFFAQGTRVVPVVHGDSVLWVVELYAASGEYPLARRFVVADGEVSYLRHAATALVNAYTGRVRFLVDNDPDPITRTWMRELDVTLTPSVSAPASLLALLPPDVDGAELQAAAFAAVGTRNEGARHRHLPSFDGGDTLAASHAATFVWVPGLHATGWLQPLLDDRDRVSGVLIATGGPSRELRWFPARDTSVHWATLLEQLQAAAGGDSRRAELRAAGRVRVLPTADGRIVALQPFYVWPPDGPPVVTRVAAWWGDSARAAPTIAAALGAPAPAGPVAATPDAQQARTRALYDEMRSALQRGDWRAFGAAFDALGALLERRRQ